MKLQRLSTILVSIYSIVLMLTWCGLAASQEVVNVYSARHYDTDETLYERFTQQTGIEVKLLEADSDALLARLEREGRRSPADVFITVDAGRLYQAEQRDVFQPVDSAILTKQIPSKLRHPEGL